MPAKQNVPKDQNLQAGLAARELAVRLVAGVLMQSRPLEQVLAEASAVPRFAALEPRDRALARAVAATVLRRQGELEHVLGAFLERPLPRDQGRLWPILLAGAAQLVCLDMPAHAVVDLAVETTRRDRGAHRFAKLVNAVLRRVAERGPELLARPGSACASTSRTGCGKGGARPTVPTPRAASPRRACARRPSTSASRATPPPGPSGSAAACSRPARSASPRTAASRTSPATPRAPGGCRTRAQPWWRAPPAMSPAAALPICAPRPAARPRRSPRPAPRSRPSTYPPRASIACATTSKRLALAAEVVEADAAAWSPGRTFDVVVLDAPCTATGTIRRHPDILRLKRPEDVARMSELQGRMLAHAATLVRPGGLLVYSTCSLEPEEAERQIAAFLPAHPDFQRSALAPAEIGAEPAWIGADGDLRTLPFHLELDPADLSGIDGFYVARLRRTSLHDDAEIEFCAA